VHLNYTEFLYLAGLTEDFRVKDHGPAESRFLFAAAVISFAQRLTLMPKGIKRMVSESGDR
jgi:hypothetical protein